MKYQVLGLTCLSEHEIKPLEVGFIVAACQGDRINADQYGLLSGVSVAIARWLAEAINAAEESDEIHTIRRLQPWCMCNHD